MENLPEEKPIETRVQPDIPEELRNLTPWERAVERSRRIKAGQEHLDRLDNDIEPAKMRVEATLEDAQRAEGTTENIKDRLVETVKIVGGHAKVIAVEDVLPALKIAQDDLEEELEHLISIKNVVGGPPRLVKRLAEIALDAAGNATDNYAKRTEKKWVSVLARVLKKLIPFAAKRYGGRKNK